MHDGTTGALERFEGTADQRFACRGEYLDSTSSGMCSSSINLRTKSKSVCEADGESDLDFLEP